MTTPAKFILKNSDVASATPPEDFLDYGELALNYRDGKLFYKNNFNQVKVISNSSEGEGGAEATRVYETPISGPTDETQSNLVLFVNVFKDGENTPYSGQYKRAEAPGLESFLTFASEDGTKELRKEHGISRWYLRDLTGINPDLVQYDDPNDFPNVFTEEYPWEVGDWVEVGDLNILGIVIEPKYGLPGAFGQIAIQPTTTSVRLFGDDGQVIVPKTILTQRGLRNGFAFYETPGSWQINTYAESFHHLFWESDYWIVAGGTISWSQGGGFSQNVDESINNTWRAYAPLIDDGEGNFAPLPAFDDDLTWLRNGAPYNFFIEEFYSDATIWQQTSDLESQVLWTQVATINDSELTGQSPPTIIDAAPNNLLGEISVKIGDALQPDATGSFTRVSDSTIFGTSPRYSTDPDGGYPAGELMFVGELESGTGKWILVHSDDANYTTFSVWESDATKFSDAPHPGHAIGWATTSAFFINGSAPSYGVPIISVNDPTIGWTAISDVDDRKRYYANLRDINAPDWREISLQEDLNKLVRLTFGDVDSVYDILNNSVADDNGLAVLDGDSLPIISTP